MEQYLPRVQGWVGDGGTRSGGFSDDPAGGEVALEKVKATDERVTWSNLSLNSHCWGSLPSPKAGESKKSLSSPSLRAPLCHPPRVNFGTSARLPISCHPLSALEPGGLHGEVMQKASPPAGACGLTVAWAFPATGQTVREARGCSYWEFVPKIPLPRGHSSPEARALLEGDCGREWAEAAAFQGWATWNLGGAELGPRLLLATTPLEGAELWGQGLSMGSLGIVTGPQLLPPPP